MPVELLVSFGHGPYASPLATRALLVAGVSFCDDWASFALEG